MLLAAQVLGMIHEMVDKGLVGVKGVADEDSIRGAMDAREYGKAPFTARQRFRA